MTTPLNLPFVKANTWDIRQTRVENSMQKCFEKTGSLSNCPINNSSADSPGRAMSTGASQINRPYENRGEIDAHVTYYGINYDSQLDPLIPLNHPYDSPAYRDCSKGPIRCSQNGDFCVTNVVSRQVCNVDDPIEVLKTAPKCNQGFSPTVVGITPKHATDIITPARVQWQCLPPSSTK